MWPFDSKRRAQSEAREDARRSKLQASAAALIAAATTAADTAHHVTSQMKRNLEDSIRQFEHTVQVLTAGLLVCNEEGVIVSSNPAAALMFGASEADLKHRPAFTLFTHHGAPLEGAAELQASLQRDEDGPGSEAALRGRRLNGEGFPVEATMTALVRSDGTMLRLLMARDVSMLAEARRCAQENAARYHALFDLSFDGILIIQEGHVVAANPAAERLFGRDLTSMLAAPVSSLISSNDPTIATTRQQQPLTADTTVTDGRRTQVMISSTGFVWNDRPACLVTAKDLGTNTLDVDLRSRRDNGVDMIACLDKRHIVTYANDAFCVYYGMARRSVIGRHIHCVLPEAEWAGLSLNLAALTRDNPVRRIQMHTPREDGSTRLQDWIDQAVFNEAGQVEEYQRVGRDITDIMTTLLNQVER